MTMLLSNDDGVHAPGLQALVQALQVAALAPFWVVAPDRDRSGVSNCLTLDRPLQATQLSERCFGVDGTPTDCIHLGTAGIFMPLPERVVSGINLGANLGDDVLYSGTVAAAMEGRFLSKPAVAFSLVVTEAGVANVERFTAAAQIAVWVLKHMQTLVFPPRTVLNVNIPDLPLAAIKGLRLTSLGQRLKGENPISTLNPRGKTLYWIGRAGGPVAREPGSDFHAVEAGYVSLTPIYADMTNHATLTQWQADFPRLEAAFAGVVGGEN
jgi:5'-nucleotidase